MRSYHSKLKYAYGHGEGLLKILSLNFFNQILFRQLINLLALLILRVGGRGQFNHFRPRILAIFYERKYTSWTDILINNNFCTNIEINGPENRNKKNNRNVDKKVFCKSMNFEEYFSYCLNFIEL